MLKRMAAWLMMAGLALAQGAFWAATPAQARNDRAGLFDYYALALSWSPSWCMLNPRKARREPQCRPGSGIGFVAHGLWPQFKRGWPSKCRTTQRFVPDAVIREVLDVMPSRGLVIHEWRKHGTCSGLSPRAYFELTERLFRSITIPAAFIAPRQPLKRAPAQIARAFAEANRDKGFTVDSFTVICRSRHKSRLPARGEAIFTELRVCLSPTGRPSRCGANEQRAACRARVVIIPPVR